MYEKIIMPGLLGWIVLALWTFIVNGVFGFRSRIDMMRVPDERRLYEVLRESMVKPGRYVCNPALSASGTFPDEDPVFSIFYSGMGHGSAGMESLLHGGELHPSNGADGQQIRVVPYRPTTLVRRSTMGFAKGRPVFFLEIPDGVPWVMLSYAQGSETWA